ncbi:phosphatidylserine decarboxylase [Vibrio tubiashii]|nr:phosphatidylserine decarboxylase [Vibrio tubiashii]
MRKSLLTLSLLSTICLPTQAESTVSAEEELAYNLGLQAFIYGAGPLTVAAVRETSTSVSQPMDNAMAPLNMMGKTRQLSGPQDRIVPTVNNDTMYSQAHYDLDLAGPMVIDIPPTGNRYYIVQLLDAYSDSITDLYEGNTGTKGSKVLLVNKGWKGEVPKGIDHVVESRTPMVWLIHRTGVFGPEDQEDAIAVHDRFITYPLGELGKKHGPIELAHAEGRIPPMTMPKGLDWYALIDKELRKNPLPEAQSMVEQFNYIGIGGEQPFDADKLSEAQKRGLLRALGSAQNIIQFAGRSVGTTNNGWSMMFEGGRYGSDYLSRASINLRAAGLNVPERALYPNRYTDSDGVQLNGEHQYRMTMPADAPADAFWSLTMYDAENLFMVENEIDRYSISTNRKEELKYAEDGTLPICIQHKKPTDSACNWLPAPKDDFYLHIRLYEPTQAVLDNQYEMPQVVKL